MNRFLVTGVSGAGKTTLARHLAAWGHHAVSADADTVLCGWYDPHGRRVTRPTHPNTTWLASHQWRWDPARLDAVIAEAEQAGAASLWLCGQAANAVELAGRFDAVFLLDIDPQTMAGRIQRPERGNDFGRVGASLDAALSAHGPFVAAWRRAGAHTVDATRDVATVAEDLLATAAMAVLRHR